MLDYETQKATIQTLPPDEQWVMTALAAWADKATVGNLLQLLKGARLPKTRGVHWQEGEVKTMLSTFEDQGYVTMTSSGVVAIAAAWRSAITMGVYLLHPEVTARMAAATYQFLQFGRQQMSRRGSNRFMGGPNNYATHARQCRLLLLQNKRDEFERLYAELNSRNFYYHIGSIVEVKQEINLSFSYFDADFWLSFHPYFHTLALTETVAHPKHWDETTAEHICVYLSDLPLDTYYGSDHRELQLTAGMMALQEVPNWPRLEKNFPGLTAVAKLLGEDRAAATPDLADQPMHDDALDLPYTLGCLYRMGEEKMSATQLMETLKVSMCRIRPAW